MTNNFLKSSDDQNYLPSKGQWNEECNRSCCTNTPARWWHHSNKRYYCAKCARILNGENRSDAMKLYGHDLCTPVPQCGVPQKACDFLLDGYCFKENEPCPHKIDSPFPLTNSNHRLCNPLPYYEKERDFLKEFLGLEADGFDINYFAGMKDGVSPVRLLTPDEITLVYTVIQWLGSTVGQRFIQDAGSPSPKRPTV